MRKRCLSCSLICRMLRYTLMILKFESIEDHLLTLQEVFTQGKELQPRNKMTKSKFAAIEPEFQYLSSRSQTSREKIEAITNIATHTNVHQVHSFLGAINHYKQVIPCHSHVSTCHRPHSSYKERCQIQMDPQLSSSF